MYFTKAGFWCIICVKGGEGVIETRYKTDVFPKDSEYLLQTVRNRKLTSIYHSHDFYELVAVVGGSCENYINGKSRTQKTGELVVLTPKDSHMFLGQSDDLELFSLSVNIGELLGAADFFGIRSEINGVDGSVMFADFSECMNEVKADREAFVETTDGSERKYKRLLCCLLSCCNTKTHRPVKNSAENVFAKVFTEMQSPENMRGGIEAMCRISGYSKPQLYRIAKKCGISRSLNECLSEIRLETAYKYIVYTDEKLESIAEAVGYRSFSHYNKLFRKRYGVSPAMLRKSKITNTV